MTVERFPTTLAEALEELGCARGVIATLQEERERQGHYYRQLQAQVRSLSGEVERLKLEARVQKAITERIAEVDGAGAAR